jgi:hypothetical protein
MLLSILWTLLKKKRERERGTSKKDKFLRMRELQNSLIFLSHQSKCFTKTGKGNRK